MQGKSERTPSGEIARRVNHVGSVLPQFTEKGNTIADCLTSTIFLEEDPYIIRRYEIINYLGKTRSGTEFKILLQKPWHTDLQFSMTLPAFLWRPFTFSWFGGKINTEFNETVLLGALTYGAVGGTSFSFYPEIKEGRLEVQLPTSIGHFSNTPYYLDFRGEAPGLDTEQSFDGYTIRRFVYQRESGLAEVTFTGPKKEKADFVLPAAITELNLSFHP